MNIQAAYKGLCLNEIINGEILDDHLQVVSKDRTWIQEELRKQNVSDFKEVLLGYIDSNNQLVVQKKNDSAPFSPLI